MFTRKALTDNDLNINLSYLEDITGGDREMMLEMLDLFINDIPAQVNIIKELSQNKDLINLGSEAHKLKPTLQYVGLFEMFELVKGLEALSKSGKYSNDLETIVMKLEELSNQCIPLLNEKREEFS